MSFRVALAVLGSMLVAATPVYAKSDDSARSCPKFYSENGTNHPLLKVTVYNGTPDDGAELLPDENGWDLEDYALSGHALSLVCTYKNTAQVHRYTIPKDMKTCKLDDKNIVCR